MKEKIQKFIVLFEELAAVYNSKAKLETKYELIFNENGYCDQLISCHEFYYDRGSTPEESAMWFYHEAQELYNDFILIDFG